MCFDLFDVSACPSVTPEHGESDLINALSHTAEVARHVSISLSVNSGMAHSCWRRVRVAAWHQTGKVTKRARKTFHLENSSSMKYEEVVLHRSQVRRHDEAQHLYYINTGCTGWKRRVQGSVCCCLPKRFLWPGGLLTTLLITYCIYLCFLPLELCWFTITLVRSGVPAYTGFISCKLAEPAYVIRTRFSKLKGNLHQQHVPLASQC